MLGFITSGLCIVIFVAVVLHKTGQDDVNASSPEDTPSSSAASESYRNPFST
jgi:hypothetical protein